MDKNRNGAFDDHEDPLSGTLIYVDTNLNRAFDDGEPHATTDSDGRYLIDDLGQGTYTVRERVPRGYFQTFPGGRGEHVVELDIGTVVQGVHFGNALGLNFGNVPEAIVMGVKWDDLNGNGEREPNEPGLPDVTIYVDQDSDEVFDPSEPHTRTQRDNPLTLEDETGRFLLGGLLPGGYLIANFPAEWIS